MVTFEQPLLLLLIIPIGLLVYLIWRRMSLPFPDIQRRLILISRLLLFTLVITALSGASWVQPVSRQATIFVGDISASTGLQRAFIEKWIRDAIQKKGPDDQVGIVAVGRNALVEQSVQEQIDFTKFESAPDTNYTNLASGLRLAAAILPANSQRHVVLLTDGQQNMEDALQEAQLLRQQGIRLDVVTLPTASTAEARINDLQAPAQLRTQERFVLRISVNSTVEQNATLRVYLDQKLLMQQSVHLVVGQQEIAINQDAPPPGFHTYRITMEVSQDTLLQNNEAAAFVNVQGPSRILVVEGKPGNGLNIASALQAAGFIVDVGTPNDVPTTLDGLASYGSVVLADVPALALGNSRMQILQSFVRDLGRGLVVSGGQNSYGLGGYANTPLEQTLPVRMDVPQRKEMPNVAVILIIETLESDISVNISKEAAKGIVNMLTPRDLVGVSAAYGTLTIPLQNVTDKQKINAGIDAMNPNDPPSYNPDFVNAEQILLRTNAGIKHVVMLGDGDAFDNYAPQITKMANENITVSTVATNSISVEELNTMMNIATWGRGRFYHAEDPGAIPQVLLSEAEHAARRAIINERFLPAAVATHPLLTGLTTFPELDGYVATTPKPAAQMVLLSKRDDPVLAAWQFGLGRSVAWTSDALGLWTKSWLEWQDAAKWWANLVTWTVPPPESELNINGKVVNGVGQITVDLPAGTSGGQNSQQQVQVRIIAPDSSQQTVNLQPTAPERWEGNFTATFVGAYLLQVTWQDQQGGNSLNATAGMVVPYSPEYRAQGVNLPFLRQLAEAGGGIVLQPNELDRVFNLPLPPIQAAFPIAFLLLILAALLLPLDIAARRLSGLEFIAMGYRWLMRQLAPGRARLATATRQATHVGTPLSTVRARREAIRKQATQGVSETPIKTKENEPEVQVTTPESKPDTPEQSLSEKLLNAKRKRGQSGSSSTPDE